MPRLLDFRKAFDHMGDDETIHHRQQLDSCNTRLYERATSAVFINGNIGEWFHTTVGVRQGCMLSPTLFNIVLERIMSDVLE